MASEDAERTESATPKRRQEGRERGEVARSLDLNSGLLLLGACGALALAGSGMGEVLLASVRDGLQFGGRSELNPETLRGLFLGFSWTVARAILPLALTVAAIGIASNLAQVGFLVTPRVLEMHWDRVDPLRGLRNLLSSRGAVEAAKALLKITVLGVVAHRTLAPEWEHFPALAGMDLLDVIRWQLGLGLRLALRVVGVYCLLGAADYGYQRWQHEKRMRMSRNEIQEEGKQQEGNPQIRARVRSLQQERRMRRMMQAVPTANVVVVNPTHIAVALKYDQSMRAPTVVAKGKRLLAERIIRLAKEAGIPVVQDIPLARSLYKLVDVGGEIPVALYKAVAKILAYVFAVRRGAA
jgi:flagellar biosynthesis protein FlhB